MDNRHSMVGPSDLWKMKRKFQFNFLKEQGLKPEHYLLDIGCGTLRGGIPLIEYLDIGHYYGSEIRADVLKEGEHELREAGLQNKNPNLVVTNNFDVGETNKFDFIWMFSVLIHLTDELADMCFEHINKQLAHRKMCYANVNVLEESTGTWEGFPVNSRPIEFYVELGKRHRLYVEDMGDLGSLGHISGRPNQDAQRMLLIRKT